MRKARGDSAFWVIDFGISKQLLNSQGQVRASGPSDRFFVIGSVYARLRLPAWARQLIPT